MVWYWKISFILELEYVYRVSFFPFDIIIKCQNKEESKKHPGPAHKVPNVMTIKKVQEDTFAVHVPAIDNNLHFNTCLYCYVN